MATGTDCSGARCSSCSNLDAGTAREGPSSVQRLGGSGRGFRLSPRGAERSPRAQPIASLTVGTATARQTSLYRCRRSEAQRGNRPDSVRQVRNSRQSSTRRLLSGSAAPYLTTPCEVNSPVMQPSGSPPAPSPRCVCRYTAFPTNSCESMRRR